MTFPDKDPYHYTQTQLSAAHAGDPNWEMKVIGDWSHPRQQQMLAFVRRR